MSQIKAVQSYLMKSKNGATAAQIVAKTDVPAGNIYPHIAVLRHKFGVPIVSEKRDTKQGPKTFFVVKAKYKAAHNANA